MCFGARHEARPAAEREAKREARREATREAKSETESEAKREARRQAKREAKSRAEHGAKHEAEREAAHEAKHEGRCAQRAGVIARALQPRANFVAQLMLCLERTLRLRSRHDALMVLARADNALRHKLEELLRSIKDRLATLPRSGL